jgi:hypothetical protein
MAPWLLFLLSLLVGPAGAIAEQPRPARDAYPRELVHEVPLDNVKADVLWAAYGQLNRRGIASNARGLRSAAFLSQLATSLFVQRSTTRDAGGRQGLATRYADLVGSVRGDGRAVSVAGIPLDGPAGASKDGRGLARYEVQVKGVNTGLRPNKVSKDDVHGSGHSWTDQALHDVIMGEFLRLNGLRAERPLLAADLGKRFKDSGYNTKAQKTVVNEKRAGLYGRGGHFMRLAHLLAATPKGRRFLVKRVRDTEEALSGRKVSSKADLVQRLVARKATELADMYWLRVAHKSLTYDNQLFFGQGDLSTAEINSQFHPEMGRTKRPGLAPGLGHEARQVMSFYVPELLRLVEGTLTPDERAGWARRSIKGADDGMRLFDARMRENVLQRLGLDPQESALLAVKRPAAASKLLTTIQKLAAKGSAAKPELDVVAGLGVLPAALRRELDGKDGRALLAKALAKSTPTDAKTASAAAAELLGAAREVARVALRPFRKEARRGKLELMEDRARRINAPIAKLQHNAHRQLATKLIDARYGKVGGRSPAKPMSLHKIQSTVDRTVRDAIRTGPYCPDALAVKMRQDEFKPVKGWFTLARWVDHGVEVAERSSGKQNRVRVKVSLDAWSDKKGPASGAILEYRTKPDGSWQRARGKVKGGDIVFQVPLKQPIESFLARVKDSSGRVRLDNSGVLYGTSAAVLGSKVVRSELVSWAQRRGVAASAKDQGLDAATVKAARLSGRRVRPFRSKGVVLRDRRW